MAVLTTADARGERTSSGFDGTAIDRDVARVFSVGTGAADAGAVFSADRFNRAFAADGHGRAGRNLQPGAVFAALEGVGARQRQIDRHANLDGEGRAVFDARSVERQVRDRHGAVGLGQNAPAVRGAGDFKRPGVHEVDDSVGEAPAMAEAVADVLAVHGDALDDRVDGDWRGFNVRAVHVGGEIQVVTAVLRNEEAVVAVGQPEVDFAPVVGEEVGGAVVHE